MQLVSRPACSLETKLVEYFFHGDFVSKQVEVDTWHRSLPLASQWFFEIDAS